MLEDNGLANVYAIGAGGPYGLAYLAQSLVRPIPLANWLAGKWARLLELIRFGGERLNVALKVRRQELSPEAGKTYLQSRLERWDAAIIFYAQKPKSQNKSQSK